MAADLAPRPEPDQPTQDLLRACNQRLVELRNTRTSYWETWRDLSHYIAPNRGRYLATPNQGNRGIPKNRAIVDRTGTVAMENLASFLMSGITSPAREWFRLGVQSKRTDQDDSVRMWCSDVEQRIMLVLALSNFYNSIAQIYEDISTFGTGAMIAMPDFEDVVRFYPLTAGEYMLDQDDRLSVDTIIREYIQSAGQLVRRFGRENCSPTVQQLYDNDQLSSEVPIVHVIQPNRWRRRGATGWQGHPWVSAYYEYGQTAQGALRIEGFRRQPFIAARWTVVSNDVYGKGPGEDALPDVKSLQIAQRRYAEAVDKIVRPPMMADASMEQKLTSLLPGGMNFISGLGTSARAGISPIYTVPAQIQSLHERIGGFQSQIKSTFRNDLIQAITNMEGVQPRNDLEIQARQQEQMLMLGPMLERFHNEALSPIIEIVYDYMDAARLIPSPPKAIQGKQVTPQYISILAQAQKSVGLTSIEQLFRFVGGLIGVDPTAMDSLDPDSAIRDYANMLGSPPDVIRGKDDVAAMRKQRAAQAEQQQAGPNAMAMAQGAQTLSNTKVGQGDTALDAIMGGIQ